MALLTLQRLLLEQPDPSILYEDNFDGSVLDSRWVVTDSETKISVSLGDLVVAGGLGTPAWNDPRATINQAFTVTAGLTLEWSAIWTTAASSAGEFGWDATNPVVADTIPGFYYQTSGVLAFIPASGTPATPVTLTSGTRYWYRIVLKNGGAIWYYSTDRNSWYALWEASSGWTGTTYAGLSNYSADLKLGYVQVRQSWVKPAAISTTPAMPELSYGSDIVTNGGMELDANWDNQGTPTTNERSTTQVQAGTYSRKAVSDASNEGIQQGMTTVVGRWYRMSGYIYLASGSAGTVDFRGDNNFFLANISATDAWTQAIRAFRATDVVHNIVASSNGGGTTTFYCDAFSGQPITLTSTIGLAGDPGTRNGIFDCAPTVGTGYQAGMMLWLDDEANPLNYLHAYVQRAVDSANTKVYLLKVVSGTTTELLVGTVTYSAAAQLRVVAADTKVAVYYDGTQVGATQTISESSYGTKVASFNTGGGSGAGQIDAYTGLGV